MVNGSLTMWRNRAPGTFRELPSVRVCTFQDRSRASRIASVVINRLSMDFSDLSQRLKESQIEGSRFRWHGVWESHSSIRRCRPMSPRRIHLPVVDAIRRQHYPSSFRWHDPCAVVRKASSVKGDQGQNIGKLMGSKMIIQHENLMEESRSTSPVPNNKNRWISFGRRFQLLLKACITECPGY